MRTFEHSLMALPLYAVRRYERHLSAASMVAGFAFDNYYFGRVDHPATQIALFGYVFIVIVSIVLVHFIESREPQGIFRRAHPLLVVATQFALGGLWSAFLIFYGRSAVIAASWPFLIILAAMLVGNEMFRKYQSRLAFTCTPAVLRAVLLRDLRCSGVHEGNGPADISAERRSGHHRILHCPAGAVGHRTGAHAGGMAGHCAGRDERICEHQSVLFRQHIAAASPCARQCRNLPFGDEGRATFIRR